MSKRSLIEINHDYDMGKLDLGLLAWALQMRLFLHTGNGRDLPNGLILKNSRHHSEDEPDVDLLNDIKRFRQSLYFSQRRRFDDELRPEVSNGRRVAYPDALFHATRADFERAITAVHGTTIADVSDPSEGPTDWAVAHPDIRTDDLEGHCTKADAEGMAKSFNRLKSMGREDWAAVQVGPGKVMTHELP